jgi:hypothetical protein
MVYVMQALQKSHTYVGYRDKNLSQTVRKKPTPPQARLHPRQIGEDGEGKREASFSLLPPIIANAPAAFSGRAKFLFARKIAPTAIVLSE